MTRAPGSPASPPSPTGEISFARQVIQDEAAALSRLGEALDHRFSQAVDLLARCADAGGTVLVTGLGKSGHIGAKISATMASLGLPSHAVHPSEAAHGDLGRFRASDVVIAISYSGETDEVVNLCAILKQDAIPIISITGGRRPNGEDGPSSLERLATVALTLGVEREAGDGAFVAPTTSTTATLALGDALALAVARRRNFTHDDFRKHHPGGSLGSQLRPVVEILRFVVGKNVPLIPHDASVAEALRLAAGVARRPGAMLIVDSTSGRLAGIFTDGDLRRLVLRNTGELNRPVGEVMTRSPRVLRADAKVADAVRMVREIRSDEIPVVDEAGQPVGVLDVQDLVAMRLVSD